MEEKSELQLQAECYKWFHNTFPELRGLLFHVNGKAKNAIEGNKFKAMGVVAGISDFVMVYKRTALGIELKTETGVVSKDQKNIHDKWESHGIKVHIVRSFEEFKELIHHLITTS